MKKAHKTILIFCIIVILILSVLSFLYVIKKNEKNIIFYYGDVCPHCKIVEDYIRDNNIKTKLKIMEKEVYRNQVNAIELQNHAKECGIEGDIGVPFIYYQGKCYIGQDECIGILKNTAGLIKNE